jgi:phage terminase large subunit-like protein
MAPTAAAIRNVMIEGKSGILAVCPPWFRPVYAPSLQRLTWPNGVIAQCYSADEPERLRGPEHGHAWIRDAMREGRKTPPDLRTISAQRLF